MKRAIVKQLPNFTAILVLCAIAAGVSAYVLAHQPSFTPPAWVPFFGKDLYELKADFQTAQAVTPGQGQTVDIAGVAVGTITNVDLVDGRARVTMKLRRRYDDVFRDATMLLRPKTQLRDMVIELNPGHPRAGRIPDGGTLPVSNTQPDVQLDEILAALDGDSRDYLRLLLAGGAGGLRGRGQELSAAFHRFDPTARDALRVSRAVARRGSNLRRLVHNFALLSTRVGSRDRDLTRLVSASNAVFASFSRRDASLRRTLTALPGTLSDTRTALARTDTLARTLGPTLQALRPSARDLAPALRDTRPFLRTTEPVLRRQIRPFTRAAAPTVRELRPAARELSALAPQVTTVLGIANQLLNELAYNPPGNGVGQEGFLFFLAWANHLGNSVLSTQDAGGPMRRGIALVTCSTIGQFDRASAASPQSGLLAQVLNVPRRNPACPQPTATRRRGR